MRFLSLEAIAFGPFTGKSIDLSDTASGLHVIYGRNESGKSSSLRALRQFLYGIPATSSDNFIHNYTNMRIAATLMRADGSRLRLVRRKGNKNTLRDGNDKDPVDESVLQELLSGIDQRQFEIMFGLDHDALIQGGQDLLSGGNDLAQIIFSSGASVTGVTKVLAALEEDAKALFKPGGQNPRINAASKQLADQRAQLRHLQLSQSDWSKHEQALSEALKAKDEGTNEQTQLQSELRRLQRIRDAHATVSRRALDLKSLEEYGPVVSLPADFADRVRALLTQQQSASTGHAQATDKIAALEKQLAEIHLPLAVLAHAESIDALYKELGSHNKGAEDLLKRETELRLCEAEITDILRSLGKQVSIEEAVSLPITSQQRALLLELMRKAQVVRENSRTVRNNLARLDKDLALKKQELAGLPPEKNSGSLQSEVFRLQKLGPLEARLDTINDELAHLVSRIENGTFQLSLQAHENSDIAKLPIPLPETIDLFREEFGNSLREAEELNQRLQETKVNRDKVTQQVDKLELEMDVPTEEVLSETRQRRDRGWQLIKRWWLDGERDDDKLSSLSVEATDQQSLAHVYEQSVAAGDETGDRLRREAQRVGQKASLLSQRAEIDRQIQELEARLIESAEKSAEVHRRWGELWAPVGIDARTPKEMISWRNLFTSVSQLLREAQSKAIEQERLTKQIEQASGDIVAALTAAGELALGERRQLAYLLEYGQQVVERLTEIEKNRLTLHRDVERLKSELHLQKDLVSNAETALGDWTQSWKRALAPLGIPETSETEEAQAVLDRLEELSSKVADRAKLIHRIEGIKRDSFEYTHRVSSLIAIVAPETSPADANIAVDDMRARLKQAQSSQAQHQSIRQQLDEQSDIAETLERTLTETANALAVMCTEAGCQAHEELLPIAQKSQDVRNLKLRLSQLDEQLTPLCGDVSLADFVKAVEAADVDSIEADISLLTTRLDALREQLDSVNQTIGSERGELARMNGASDAAVAAEQIESICAQIRDDSEQYARFKLAEVLLRKAVERYRDKNQSPVLQRASEIFAGLTCGSFAALRSDVDDRDATVLLGVRGRVSGEVGVDGMSEGTRDQLYLALRLASVEYILRGHEPIPFIVDDILVNFDDERAAAALEALANLSRVTQVLFFTHHAHLVELARRTLPASSLFVHELDRESLAPIANWLPARADFATPNSYDN